MTIAEYLAECARLERDARELLGGLDPATTRLDAAKGALNALKDQRVAALQGALRSLPPEDRRAAGTAFNTLKQAIAGALEDFERRQPAAGRAGATLDLTMPARRQWLGARHPVTLVIEEIEEIFRELVFTVAMGPDAET